MKTVVLLFFFLACTFSATAQPKQINVAINKNIEVIDAVTISLNPEMLQDSARDPWMFNNTQLMRIEAAYCKPFEQHKAVEMAKRLMDKIGTGVYLFSLYYEDLPVVKRKGEVPEIIWSELNKNKELALAQIDSFMLAAADYYKVANLRKFQEQHRYIYTKALQEIKRNLPGDGFIKTLEAYYGDSKGSYNIIVMPFFKSDWGMGWETITNGRTNIFNITAPFQKQVVANGKVLQAGYDDATKITNLTIHEFGHSFVNTLTAREPFLSAIKKFDSLFTPIQNQQQYRDWVTLFNEHTVRAGEIIVMQQLGDTAFANKTKASYSNWVYLDHFINQLKTYTANRDKYPTFKDFLPTLVGSLAGIKK